MSALHLPPILFHGTSSLKAPSILNSGLNPIGTYTGRLVLATSYELAIHDALEKTYWDRQTVEWTSCETGIDIQPVVCEIETAVLLPQFIVEANDNNLVRLGIGSNSNACPPRISYTGIIPVRRDSIRLVNTMKIPA